MRDLAAEVPFPAVSVFCERHHRYPDMCGPNSSMYDACLASSV